MLRAVQHLCQRSTALLFLDPGLRKTSITLAAFRQLKYAGIAHRMLVVAPLRVCRNQWRQEAQLWDEFRDLRFVFLHGDNKAKGLETDADIYLINPEGVDWLSKRYFGRQLPFDTVVFDELTKFKNSGATRFKALRPRLTGIPRRWGLTGTPAPNGYMDLFGQVLMLDDGRALGRYITHFRDMYFQLSWDGYDYELMPAAGPRVEAAIRPYVLQMSAEDYIKVPEIVPDPIMLDWEPKARSVYKAMKRDLLATLPQGVITAANSAACYSKLSQMANGAIYLDDTHREAAVLHDTKLDALDELIDGLNGQQLLIAYEFQHDLERLRQHFNKPGKPPRLHVIGAGVSETKEAEVIDLWNKGRIQLVAAHPASVGHGLNLQKSNCAHVCWFSPIWDLELWDQFIRRVRRSGNDALHVLVHILMMRDSLDELKYDAIGVKDVTQKRLLKALSAEILRDADTHTPGVTGAQTETTMVVKLSRGAPAGQPNAAVNGAANNGGAALPPGWGGQPQTQAAPQQPAATAAAPVAMPAGWGKPPTGQSAPAPQPQADDGQRERVAAAITGHAPMDSGVDNRAAAAAGAFSPQLTQTIQGFQQQQSPTPLEQAIAQQDPPFTPQDPATLTPAPAATTKRTRRKKDEPEAEAQDASNGWQDPAIVAEMAMKAEILKVAFNDPTTTLDDGLEIAASLLEWVRSA